MKKIVVAGGCFWGVEEYYKRLKGIINTKVGYAQGVTSSPSYEEVCTGDTNHAEVVYLEYDENVISLKKIAEHLFRIIDPTSLNKQANDIGTQYRTGFYYIDNEDYVPLNNFLTIKSEMYNKPIVVELQKLDIFYDAEDYHQDYLDKNPTGYCHVDFSKIRDDELK